MALLETRDLTKEFGGLVAVERANLAVDQGETVSIIGPNGAGKTTFINLVTSLLDPTSGDVIFDGETITHLDPHEIVQRGVSRTFQTASIFPELTVEENVRIAAFATEHGSFRFNFLQRRDSFPDVADTAGEVLDAVELYGDKDVLAEELPYGDKRRLEIAVSMACEPTLLFMDEPTAGMSPEETQSTTALIERVKEELGLTIVLVEHDMEVVFDVSDRIVVLHRGEIIADGPPSQVQGDPQVQEAYLGGVEL